MNDRRIGPSTLTPTKSETETRNFFFFFFSAPKAYNIKFIFFVSVLFCSNPSYIHIHIVNRPLKLIRNFERRERKKNCSRPMPKVTSMLCEWMLESKIRQEHSFQHLFTRRKDNELLLLWEHKNEKKKKSIKNVSNSLVETKDLSAPV